jgi:hypothetical protein
MSLTNNTKYNNLVSYYEDNKNKPWEEWLELHQVFDKPGKQGIVGLFNNKENKKEQYVFKISQYINYLVYHELIIMQGLSDISIYCPHFCKGIGIIKSKVEPKYKKSENPFEIKSKYAIEKDILLCEYIDKSCKFYNYIRSNNVDEDVLYSIVKQVLLGITIAQKEKKFTHYDLHSFNVMVKKCNKDLVFLYKIDNENQFCVPTLGHYPIIIDYGFSFIEDMNDNPLWASLAHTDVGFMSDRFDWVADPKLFLVTVAGEIKEKRRTKKSRILKQTVKKIFKPLTIDWESGWDDVEEQGAADYVLEMLESYNSNSRLFEDYDYYCIDIIQSQIILPLEEQKYDDIGNTYKIFLNEWIKIENEISNHFYNLYILRELVNIARNIRPDYLNLKTRKESICDFTRGVYAAIDKVTKFCVPKNVHFEKMLCSLLMLAKNIEGVLYEIISSQMKDKQKEYDKMPVDNIEQIYGKIASEIEDEYVYNKNTKVMIIDNVNKNCNIFQIPEEELDNINNLHPLTIGTYINKLYEKNEKNEN